MKTIKYSQITEQNIRGYYSFEFILKTEKIGEYIIKPEKGIKETIDDIMDCLYDLSKGYNCWLQEIYIKCYKQIAAV